MTSLLDLAPFQLDPDSGTLWVGGEPRRLRPKAVQGLRYLAERSGRICSHEELLDAVWPDVNVARGTLKVHVWEIRRALGDRGRPARFLETLPRRGYRWLARPQRAAIPPGAVGGRATRIFVGRESELSQLGAWLDQALRGDRQVVLVSGEAGVGKTALVETFLGRAVQRADLCLAVGPCIEQRAGSEAYLPVLSALGHLARGTERVRLARALRRSAPSWLALLPSLGAAAASGATPSGGEKITRSRLLREIAEALEHLAARKGLLIVLEDLQWADPATIDLLSFLARRPGRARLFLLCTVRPVDAGRSQSAAIDDLQNHRLAVSLPLQLWGEPEVEAYVAARLAPTAPDRRGVHTLARALLERTEGNPLFAVNAMEDLLAAAALSPSSGGIDPARAAARLRELVPSSLEQMIAARVARLEADDQRLLEAASAIGVEVPAAALGAALGCDLTEVEERCARLARGTHLLQAVRVDVWPDGTVAGRFAFRHSLYRDVLYERVTPARRRRLHEMIAQRLEVAFADRAGEIASELALHFDAAGRAEQAVRYLELAADLALQRHAQASAIGSLERALELVATLPSGDERTRRELALQLRLGAPLLMARGYAAPEVARTYARALELSAGLGDSIERLIALVGMFRFSLVRSELVRARELAEQAVGLADRTGLPLAHLVAQFMRGMAGVGAGDFATARDGLERSLALYDPVQHGFLALTYGDDPGVGCLAELAMVLWFQGFPDEALAKSEAALARAREVAIPYSLAFALNYAIWSRLLRGEARAGLAHADELVSLARAQEFEYWVAQGTAIRGWVLIDCGEIDRGMAELSAGLAAYEALGAEVMRPWHLGKLAQAHQRAGRLDRARETIAQAVQAMERKEERFYEAELLRLQGELGMRDGARGREEAEGLLRRAVATAQRQGARSLELRAATSLAHLWAASGRQREAGAMLAPIVAWFREGAATSDHVTARATLARTARGESGY